MQSAEFVRWFRDKNVTENKTDRAEKIIYIVNNINLENDLNSS